MGRGRLQRATAQLAADLQAGNPLPQAIGRQGKRMPPIVLRCTEAGRRRWAGWVYAIPIVGTLLRAARLAAFTDLLALLVDYELPLPRAFELAGAASSDPIMAGAARQVVLDLQQGVPLARVMRERDL